MNDILCCTSCPESSAEPVTHCIYGLPRAAFLTPASTGVFSPSHLLSPAETLDQEQGLSQSQHLILCVVMSCSEHVWTRFPWGATAGVHFVCYREVGPEGQSELLS